jgi:ribonuclease E
MDQQDDPIFPEAGHVNGTSVVGTTESPGVTEADPPTAAQPQRVDSIGLRPGFLSELANAMRATAERERETIAARVAEDAAGHIEKVRARAAIETEELKRLAEEDVDHIQDWAKGEMERIRSEADQKIADRRSSLDEYLQQHDAIIEGEIEGVDAAVAEYGTTLDGFFAELSEAGDPAAIVARAEALPPPPDLDTVRAKARASAVAMFAEPEETVEPAQATAEAVAADEAPAEAIGETVVATDNASDDAGADVPAVVDAESAEAAEFVAPTADVDATNGSGEGDGMTAIESPAAEPVPVMDPAATADHTWPAPAAEPASEAAPEPEPEREPVAASLDHTSAAVRLLRSVAPWTAPNHAESENRPDHH